MIYYKHTNYLYNFWNDIEKVIEENYSFLYDDKDLICLGTYLHKSFDEIKELFPEAKKIIAYQLEPLVDGHWWSIEHIINKIKYYDEIWDYDIENIKILKSYGIDAKHMPILYANSLKRIEDNTEKDIDVLFYGTLTDRRIKILSKLTNYNFKVVIVRNIDGIELDKYISRSKLILNLHCHEDNRQEQTRINYLLTNNKLVISEKSKINYFENLIDEIEETSDIDNIVFNLLNKINYYLIDNKWIDKSLNLSENLKVLDFNKKINLIKKNNNKIAIFYHLYQIDYWEIIFKEQFNKLKNYGLLDVIDFIHIGKSGNEHIDANLYYNINNINIEKNNILDSESETLLRINDFSIKNPNYKILYLHSKGITHYGKEYYKIIDNWRNYLEYFNIENWKKCINLLENYDCVSTEWCNNSCMDGVVDENGHYSGNIWWSTAKYLSNLNKNYLFQDNGLTRFNSEFWIGSKKPKYYSFYNHNKNPYFYNIERKEYEMKNKKTKIVMISMFKNESKTIKRMLESCYKYIDYYILQDNGSTDGTPQIVEEFFKNKNIPGFVYKVEEGWISFGWNRDHLLQKCLNTNHNCDWILKMDCDELLEVDEDFEWSLLDDTSIQSFNILAKSGNYNYYRTWMWNSKLPWKFHHDTCHETIYLDKDNIGESFQRVDLPKSFRQIGTTDGESYTVPTKYLTDALKLEEKLIRENNLFNDMYHFWYIGKSYNDCYRGNFYPLKDEHSKEFARRTIFYFEEYINYVHKNYKNTKKCLNVDEMSYFAMTLISEAYDFLGNTDKAIEIAQEAEHFCPRRNDHLILLYQYYDNLNKTKDAFEIAKILIRPERTNPFPEISLFINSDYYHDTGKYIEKLYNKSMQKFFKNIIENSNNKDEIIKNLKINFSENKKKAESLINNNKNKRFFVIDNFYTEPNKIRELALNAEYEPDLKWYKGHRSKQQYLFDGLKESFEQIIDQKITVWKEYNTNGKFQYCTAEDPLVYHHDLQKWAAIIYLTPNAPYESGTSFYASKNGAKHAEDSGIESAFAGGFYDKTKFELIDTVGNVYNRLIIFDAKLIHSANQYFGTNLNNGRLFQIFFFD